LEPALRATESSLLIECSLLRFELAFLRLLGRASLFLGCARLNSRAGNLSGNRQ
jgi:hypothetical protein